MSWFRRSTEPIETEYVIEARNLYRRYASGNQVVEALRDVDFLVRPGEIVGIMGPSGCGKTTLLNCLAGLDDPDEGFVKIEGINLRALSDDKRTMHRAKRMGFVFQAHSLLSVLNARENVELPMLAAGLSTRQAREKAEEALEAVGLRDRMHHRPTQLSGGQQQRVSIARAVAINPAIVWADEPTGNLDSNTAEEILHLFEHLNATLGQTLVIVTHDPNVGDRCHRVVHMSDGMLAVPLYVE